ncbi:MAG: ferrous iron transport protein A [Flavobacteriales bacterium]|nr:ferrous iron transport protein A [Flavobacteriales bacterium]
METALSNMHKGQTGKIIEILDCALEQQLVAMGCVPGEQLFVENFAPFKDPIEVRIQDQFISIRVADAGKIIIAI